MSQRGVTSDQVRQTLRHPDRVRRAKREDAQRFEKQVTAKKSLCVIATEDDQEFRVISVWWL